MPHAVQLLTSEERFASQPSIALMLQSPQPGSHVPAEHFPATQVALWCAPEQAMAQPPQLATSVCGSTQRAPQHFCAFAQFASLLQPTAHCATASEMILQ